MSAAAPVPAAQRKKTMKSRETTTRTPADLDATDEFPVLDPVAYEATVARPSAGAAACGTIEDLTARLTTSEADRRALEERVAALTKEVANNYSRLKRLESMNAELRETVGQLNTSLAERGGELRRRRGNHLDATAFRHVDETPR